MCDRTHAARTKSGNVIKLVTGMPAANGLGQRLYSFRPCQNSPVAKEENVPEEVVARDSGAA